MKWRVCFEVVTEESAIEGDASERGFIGEFNSLRDAIENCGPRTNRCDGGTWWPSSYPIRDTFTWFTRYFYEWESGDHYTVSIHPPRNITLSSLKRLERFLASY